MGTILGEANAIGVLFGYGKLDGVSQKQAFAFASIVIGALGVLTLFFIKNPQIKYLSPVKKKYVELP